MVWLTEARTPPDMRIYAIGDIHGCIDHIQRTHVLIGEDLARYPVADWRVVHVGDFVDRGPNSAAVIQYMIERTAHEPRLINILGNHDYMFAESLDGNARMQNIWLQNGGETTLADYGLRPGDLSGSGSAARSRVPEEHVAFLRGLKPCARFADYMFVHAGIDPDVPLDDQSTEDMMWIRNRFLGDGREFDAVIVHGHTPSRKIDIRENRIGIDTGAVYGGALTCIVLEGSAKGQIGPEGRRPLMAR